MDPDPDYMTLKQVEEFMSNRADARERELEGMRQQLRSQQCTLSCLCC